jgi:hypothetical protein
MARCSPLLARVAICAFGLTLSIGTSGCGSSSSESSNTTAATSTVTPPANAALRWRTRTQEVCRAGRAAVARLGYVHITEAGIAQLGLPAVKQKLDSYLGRLLAILRSESRQQQRLAPPPELGSAATAERRIERDEQQATGSLRAAVASAKTAGQLSAAFRVWLHRDAQLVAEANALARRLHLPGCVAGAP